MKKIAALLLILSSCVFSQFGTNRSRWTINAAGDTIMPINDYPLKVSGLRSTGAIKIEGVATFSSSVSTDIDITGRLAISDSIRVEKTSRQKGTITFGATATSGTLASTGKITSPDTIVSVKGFRTEGPSLLKGQVTLGTGSDAAPELAGAGDTNTGIRFPGGDKMQLVQGGLNSHTFRPYRYTLTASDGDTLGINLDGSAVRISSNVNIAFFTRTGSALNISNTGIYKGHDSYSNGASDAAWKSYYGSDNIYLGGKGQTATMYVSQENTIAGSDSSWKFFVDAGVPKLQYNGTDGDTWYLSGNTSDEATLSGAAGLTLDTGTAVKVGAVQWDVAGTDYINSESIAPAPTFTGLVTVNTSGSTGGVKIDGNKTSADLLDVINDNDGAVGDSTFKVGPTGSFSANGTNYLYTNNTSTSSFGTYGALVLKNTNNTNNNYTDFLASDAGGTVSSGLSFKTTDHTNHYGNIYVATRSAAGWHDANLVISANKLGIGGVTPVNTLDVEGGVAIGATYSGTSTAPTNGLLVEGNVGIGVTTAGAKTEINGNKSTDSLLIVRNDRIGSPYDSVFVVLPTGGTRSTGTYGGSAIEPITAGSSATTFAITKNNVAVTGDAGGNTIATITGGGAIGLYTFKFIDDKITITDTDAGTANTINTSAAFTSTANDILVLFWDGTSWYEASRSVN